MKRFIFALLKTCQTVTLELEFQFATALPRLLSIYGARRSWPGAGIVQADSEAAKLLRALELALTEHRDQRTAPIHESLAVGIPSERLYEISSE